MPPGEGIRVELVEEERLSGAQRDLSRPARYRAIVNCGKALPDMKVKIRGEDGHAKGDHQIGKVWCHGPSVMHSYFRNEDAMWENLQAGAISLHAEYDPVRWADGYTFPAFTEGRIQRGTHLVGCHRVAAGRLAVEVELDRLDAAVITHVRTQQHDLARCGLRRQLQRGDHRRLDRRARRVCVPGGRRWGR